MLAGQFGEYEFTWQQQEAMGTVVCENVLRSYWCCAVMQRANRGCSWAAAAADVAARGWSMSILYCLIGIALPAWCCTAYFILCCLVGSACDMASNCWWFSAVMLGGHRSCMLHASTAEVRRLHCSTRPLLAGCQTIQTRTHTRTCENSVSDCIVLTNQARATAGLPNVYCCGT